jgi:hypothetical protein
MPCFVTALNTSFFIGNRYRTGYRADPMDWEGVLSRNVKVISNVSSALYSVIEVFHFTVTNDYSLTSIGNSIFRRTGQSRLDDWLSAHP